MPSIGQSEDPLKIKIWATLRQYVTITTTTTIGTQNSNMHSDDI